MAQANIHLLTPAQNGPIKSFGMPGTPDAGNMTSWAIACVPAAVAARHATGEANAVTCENCKKTAAFAALEKAQAFAKVNEEDLTLPTPCEGC